ncbi:MAG: M20/M25/M40 family metallo-hydrolase [Pyrinomonadaceae bacterium]
MRKLKLYSLILLLALSFALPTTFAQRRAPKAKSTTSASPAVARGADFINAAQLKDYLSFIASDEMEGRDTPSRGLDTTAKFIAMNLSRWGFKPAGDDGYFQRIALSRNQLDSAASHAEINGQRFNLGDDFLPNAVSATIIGPLVYVGHGWMIKSKNLDAYQGVDVKDKIVVVFGEGLPKGVNQSDLTGTRGEDWANPLLYAQRHGAKGVLAIPDFSMLLNWDRSRQRASSRGNTVVDKFQTPASTSIPAIWLSAKMATALFQGEKYEANALMNRGIAGDAVEPFELSAGKKVSFTVATKSDKIQTQNVVAVWEGSDPVLKNEYVALGAHYDHIGIATTPVNGDSINNGADDDGSGTTALLAMAEALTHAKARPKRSVLFVWHAGEEKGLWGSRYFTENPTIALDRIVTQINIDMIGRSRKDGDTNPRNKELSGPNEIYVIGSKMMSTELGELTDAVNKSYLNVTYDYRYDDPNDPNRFFFRSDHYNYARKGIPIVFFFDGVHEDYHRPGDSADKIDYQKMERVARTVYMTLWEVATRPTRPKVDKQLPAQLMQRN